jgi:hypothetical protein
VKRAALAVLVVARAAAASPSADAMSGGSGVEYAAYAAIAVLAVDAGFTIYDAAEGHTPDGSVAAPEMVVGGLQTVALGVFAIGDKNWPVGVLAAWPAALTVHGAWTSANGRIPMTVALAPVGGVAVDAAMLLLWPKSSSDVAVVPRIAPGQTGIAIVGRF